MSVFLTCNWNQKPYNVGTTQSVVTTSTSTILLVLAISFKISNCRTSLSPNHVISIMLHVICTGTECRMCEAETVCHDSGTEVDPLEVFDGKQGLHLTFQSNRQGSGCGFRLLATCAKRTLFETPNCTIPASPPLPTSSTPFPLDFSKRVRIICS